MDLDLKPATIPDENDAATLTEDFDSDAPYGRFANGNPRKNPPKGSDTPKPKRGYTSGGSKNDALAESAADLLAQLNGLLAMGAMTIGFTDTASTIAERNDAFKLQAIEALKTDPALCKQILKAGSTSGKVALILAYGMMAASVIPTGIVEYRDKKAAVDNGSAQ